MAGFNLKQKHLDLLPEVLDFIVRPLETTPSPLLAATPLINQINNLQHEILDVLYKSTLEVFADEVLAVIDDAVPAKVRAARTFDFHGSRLDINPVASLSDEDYKILIEAISTALQKGATIPSVLEGLLKLFGDAAIVEMKDVTDNPAFRKIFRVQLALVDFLLQGDEQVAFDVLVLYLTVVKSVTTDFEIDNILAEAFEPFADELVKSIFFFNAFGPILLDPKISQDMVNEPISEVEADYEIGFDDIPQKLTPTGIVPAVGGITSRGGVDSWYKESHFMKNGFTNQVFFKNNFDLGYTITFEERAQFDAQTLVIT